MRKTKGHSERISPSFSKQQLALIDELAKEGLKATTRPSIVKKIVIDYLEDYVKQKSEKK